MDGELLVWGNAGGYGDFLDLGGISAERILDVGECRVDLVLLQVISPVGDAKIIILPRARRALPSYDSVKNFSGIILNY